MSPDHIEAVHVSLPFYRDWLRQKALDAATKTRRDRNPWPGLCVYRARTIVFDFERHRTARHRIGDEGVASVSAGGRALGYGCDRRDRARQMRAGRAPAAQWSSASLSNRNQ